MQFVAVYVCIRTSLSMGFVARFPLDILRIVTLCFPRQTGHVPNWMSNMKLVSNNHLSSYMYASRSNGGVENKRPLCYRHTIDVWMKSSGDFSPVPSETFLQNGPSPWRRAAWIQFKLRNGREGLTAGEVISFREVSGAVTCVATAKCRTSGTADEIRTWFNDRVRLGWSWKPPVTGLIPVDYCEVGG